MNDGIVRNQANQCALMLVADFGFEERGPLRALAKVIDDQHGLTASLLGHADRRALDEPDGFRIELGIARRDINEHLVRFESSMASLFEDGWWDWGTVNESSNDSWFGNDDVFGNSVVQLSYDQPFSLIRPRVVEVVELLHGMANLDFVEAELYRERRWDSCAGARAVNDALNGDNRGQAFWDRVLAQLAARNEGPMKDEAIARIARFEANIAAFRARFPGGVPRL